MRTAIILPTAFIPAATPGPDADLRIKQYVDGFARVAELGRRFPEFDFFWADNTIDPALHFDERMYTALRAIPNLKKEYGFYENDYGRINKGCGVLAVWKKVMPDVAALGYDYVIHFEPRQEILNFSFFETYAAAPKAYFKEMHPRIKYLKIFSKTIDQVWTGLFSCVPKDLLDYAESRHIPTFASRNKIMESDVYDYLKNKGISYQHLPDLGLRWHDGARNRYVLI